MLPKGTRDSLCNPIKRNVKPRFGADPTSVLCFFGTKLLVVVHRTESPSPTSPLAAPIVCCTVLSPGTVPVQHSRMCIDPTGSAGLALSDTVSGVPIDPFDSQNELSPLLQLTRASRTPVLLWSALITLRFLRANAQMDFLTPSSLRDACPRSISSVFPFRQKLQVHL